jgi:hypothetical protein
MWWGCVVGEVVHFPTQRLAELQTLSGAEAHESAIMVTTRDDTGAEQEYWFTPQETLFLSRFLRQVARAGGLAVTGPMALTWADTLEQLARAAEEQ